MKIAALEILKRLFGAWEGWECCGLFEECVINKNLSRQLYSCIVLIELEHI